MYQKICTRHNLADACLHMVFFICQKFSKGSEPFSSSGKVVGKMTPREYVIQQLQDHNKIRKEISVLEFELKALLTMNSNDLIESMTFVPSVTETVQSSSISDKTASIALNYQQVYQTQVHETVQQILVQLNESLSLIHI